MVHVAFASPRAGHFWAVGPQHHTVAVASDRWHLSTSAHRRRRSSARNALATFLIFALALAGCSSERPTAPSVPVQPDTQPAGTTRVTVNAVEFGGSQLTVMSAFGTAPVNGGSAMPIVPGGANQLLYILDAAGQVRGVTMATTDSSGVHVQAADAVSTAKTVLLLTPGIFTSDSALLAQRLEAIRASPCLPGLASALRAALLTVPLDQALDADDVRAALHQCTGAVSASVRAADASVRTANALASDYVSAHGFGVRSVPSEPAPYLTLDNQHVLTPDVYRRDVYASGSRAPIQVGTLPSAQTISVGSVLTSSAHEPGVLDDFDTPMQSSAPVFEYYIAHAGTRAATDPVPPGIPTDRLGFLSDLWDGLVKPILGSFCGTCWNAAQLNAIGKDVVRLAEVGEKATSLNDLWSATSSREAKAAMIDVAVGMVHDATGIACVSLALSPVTCASWVALSAAKVMFAPVPILDFAWDVVTTPSVVRLQLPNIVGPRVIAITSGDEQRGVAGERLAQEVVVVVTNKSGGKRRSVPVFFEVASGGGSVGTPSTVTDDLGQARTTWRLGATVGAQTVVARLTSAENTTVMLHATASTPTTSYTITLSSNPSAGGSTTGGGTFSVDPNDPPTRTVTAVPAPTYQFKNWTENGTVVSTDLSYGFTLTGTRTLVANFTLVPVAPPQSALTITVTPVDGIALAAAQRWEYTIVVKAGDAPVAGAIVSGTDPVAGRAYQTPATDQYGVTHYTTEVAVGTALGDHDIPFVASKSGFASSETVTRLVIVVAQPTLTLTVEPTGTQSLSPGASKTYQMTLRDATGTPVGNATIVGKDDLIGGNYASSATDQQGMATYTARASAGAAPGNYTLTFKAQKSGYSSSAEAVRIISVVPASTSLHFTSNATLPQATVDVSYRAPFELAGGSPPYTCAVVSSGELPSGLSQSDCAISGTPRAAGSSTFAVRGTDAAGLYTTMTFSLSISAAVAPLRFAASATLPHARVGDSYSTSLDVTGGEPPYSCTSSPALPSGLSFSGCAIVGRPTNTGTSTFSVTASDAGGRTTSQSFSLTIDAAVSPPSVTTLAATEVKSSSFRGNLSITITGQAGQWAIEWSTNSSVTGSVSSTNGEAVQASPNAQPVSAVISGLACGVTYYFRGVVVQNGNAARGGILSVTTEACLPVITSVSPSSPVGSSSPQLFTINGTGFDSSATVTLRDITRGNNYSDRTVRSRSSTSIVINPVFGTEKNDWTVQVINPGGNASVPFAFKIK